MAMYILKLYVNSSNTKEEIDIPLNSYSFNSHETMFIPHTATSEKVNIAPREGKVPVSIFNDNFCEELAFPCLFSAEKFGYKVKRNLNLSPVKYFNQPLLNYTQRITHKCLHQILIIYFCVVCYITNKISNSD